MTTIKTLKSAMVLLAGTAMAPIALAGNQGYAPHAPELVPHASNPGECYARVKVPAEYSTSTEQIMVEEGYSTVDVSQPSLAPRQENVMIKEASVRYRVRQPSYRSVTEQMMIRPAYDKLTVSAPQFSTVTETIQTSAPRLIWKRGNPGKLAAQGYTIHSTANAGSYSQGHSGAPAEFRGATECGATCEIWCLVEEPGEQVQYNRKVMTSPGQVQRQTVPAQYRTITKQVVSDPGGVEEIPVPAEYRSVTVEDIVDPGGERVVNVPPKFAEVATKHLVSPERYEWRRVLCAPGTGSIKPSASYGTAQPGMAAQTTYSSAPIAGAGVVTGSDGYMAGSGGQSHGGQSYGGYSYESSSGTLPGTGYYGGYGDAHSSQGSDHYSGSNHHYKSKRKRKRRSKGWR
jgi:hypothetical protein